MSVKPSPSPPPQRGPHSARHSATLTHTNTLTHVCLSMRPSKNRYSLRWSTSPSFSSTPPSPRSPRSPRAPRGPGAPLQGPLPSHLQINDVYVCVHTWRGGGAGPMVGAAMGSPLSHPLPLNFTPSSFSVRPFSALRFYFLYKPNSLFRSTATPSHPAAIEGTTGWAARRPGQALAGTQALVHFKPYSRPLGIPCKFEDRRAHTPTHTHCSQIRQPSHPAACV